MSITRGKGVGFETHLKHCALKVCFQDSGLGYERVKLTEDVTHLER